MLRRSWVGDGPTGHIATVLLSGLAVALTRNPSQPVLMATTAVFAGLIASYVAAVATGLPVLHPEREAVDGLALFTQTVERVGLALAAGLLRRPSLVFVLPRKGTLT